MAINMMTPLTSPSRATMTMVNNSKEYYSFHVNVCDDTFTCDERKKRLIIPSGQSLTQENLRQKLYDQFGIKKDSCISYIDGDGDDLPIESECEFQEALKLAKTFVPNKGLVLVVRPWKLTRWNNILDMEQCNKTTKCQDTQNIENIEKMTQNCASDLNSMTHAMTDLVSKMCEKQLGVFPSNTWFEIDDSNVSSQRHSSQVLHKDTSPPPWFIEYMESMKKEMVSTITQEVVEQMTEMLDKRLDSFTSSLFNETSQYKRRSHSSLSKRHSRYSFESHSNEKNQKRINVQDEGQFSDASIERVDEPQDMNVNVNVKDHDRQLQQAKLYLHDLDNIKGQIHELLKEKQYYRVDDMTNNLDTGINRQDRRESIQSVNDNNVQEDIASPVCCMTSDALKILDGEFRMNCSITGNRALNMDSSHENTWCNDLMEDIDRISHYSGCSILSDEREHMDTFVMVEMPMPENVDPSLKHPKVSSAAELQQRDNSRDSPSFELLSETPSPRSSSYICEEHFVNVFSANEKDLQTSVVNSNSAVSSAYMVDIHGKIYNEHVPTTPGTNIEFEKRSDGIYSFVAETLPVREIDSSMSKLSHAEQQTFSEQKSSQYNTTNLNNERNQLPNYSRAADDQHHLPAETFYWKMHSQSQTDASDFVQSFHSHTTSVTDNNNDLFYQPTNYVEQKTAIKNTQKSTTTTTTSPRKATQYNTRDKRSSRVRADETRCDDTGKFVRPQQSNRPSGFDNCSNGSRRTSEQLPNATADPVLILPEALLTMATQMGSIAYVTARDMFDKLRSHTDDPVKRRRVKLNTTTQSSFSSATHRPVNQS
ncbi:PREDICTED: uncharacterized protein LOC106749967 isoform X2 [Dinoponera quadriceps]|uniref:Uncharacterized protein LOC106749967 isoform X2 n=1 Tax=Dinoponera quadriceps TaxID=609295 RepID=A0A6P3Y3L5_DINQU|nr:PREDICTED: uncharacterized protein LOC106749967 isoform X2 [Dinoponera quadriceps]